MDVGRDPERVGDALTERDEDAWGKRAGDGVSVLTGERVGPRREWTAERRNYHAGGCVEDVDAAGVGEEGAAVDEAEDSR